MTTLNTAAALAALVALVQGLDGMQGTVYQGVPESFAAGVSAYVAIGDLSVADKTTGGGRAHPHLKVEQDFLVVFGYRVRGSEMTAEGQVADFKDKLVRALFADRTLGEIVDEASLVSGLAGTPQYLAFAGSETRLYPLTVRVCQTSVL